MPYLGTTVQNFTTPLGTLQAITEETLFPTIYEEMQELSPLYKMIFPDSTGVERDDKYGEGYICRKQHISGLGGSYTFKALDDGSLSLAAAQDGSGAQFNIYGDNAFRTYPGASVSTAPAVFRYHVPLADSVGNCHIPHQIMRAAQQGANIGYDMGRIIKGLARRIALTHCNALWATSVAGTGDDTTTTTTLQGVIGTFLGDGVGTNNNALSGAYQLNGGSLRCFEEGLLVDVYRFSGSAQTNAGQWLKTTLFATRVDRTSNRLRFWNRSGSTWTPGNGVTQAVCIAGSYDAAAVVSGAVGETGCLLPFNFERLIKTSGTIYGRGSAYPGLNLAYHPDFRSYEYAVNGPLDEQVLRSVLATLEHSVDGLRGIDTLVAREFVWAGFQNFHDAFYTMERNGQAVKITAGIENDRDSHTFMTMQAFGRKYQCRWDPWAPPGEVLGHKFGGKNWKLKAPPRLPGAGTMSNMPGGIEFIAQAAGFPTNFAPHIVSSEIVGGVQMPFNLPMQVDAEEIRGLRLTNIQEETPLWQSAAA